jgi:hypothetical protein
MAVGVELASARCTGRRSAPLRAAGRRFWVGASSEGWQAGGHEHGLRIAKTLRVTLGIGSPWAVKDVALKLAEKKVEIELGWQWGSAAQCPECGRECSLHDSAPERTWRHLDTMQFITVIRARTPRANCPEHGVKTMTVPWAAPQGRFTLHFERRCCWRAPTCRLGASCWGLAGKRPMRS